MAEALVEIDANRITDWDSFHEVFAEAFGFPDFYGKNANAWIDCMQSLGDPDDPMTKIVLPSGSTLVLMIKHAAKWRVSYPKIALDLMELTAAVNCDNAQVKVGYKPALIALAFDS